MFVNVRQCSPLAGCFVQNAALQSPVFYIAYVCVPKIYVRLWAIYGIRPHDRPKLGDSFSHLGEINYFQIKSFAESPGKIYGTSAYKIHVPVKPKKIYI